MLFLSVYTQFTLQSYRKMCTQTKYLCKILLVSFKYVPYLYVLFPNMRLPIRTILLPSSMAIS